MAIRLVLVIPCLCLLIEYALADEEARLVKLGLYDFLSHPNELVDLFLAPLALVGNQSVLLLLSGGYVLGFEVALVGTQSRVGRWEFRFQFIRDMVQLHRQIVHVEFHIFAMLRRNDRRLPDQLLLFAVDRE